VTTKTLELKLVEPNAHKRENSARRERRTNRRFTTPSTLAVPHRPKRTTWWSTKLSGYAKNALKKYVPQLTTTYNAGELHDAHPVRFTNEGLRLDHKPENAIEWYVKIPHHEDYHLWMPAQPNPEQRDWFGSVERGRRHDGRESAIRAGRNVVSSRHRNPRRRGRFRGVRRRTDTHRCRYWEASLVTVCHRDDHGADRSRTMGRRREDRSSAPQDLLHRHEATSRHRGSERIAESFGDDLWNQIDDVFHRVTRGIVDYAESVKNPFLFWKP